MQQRGVHGVAGADRVHDVDASHLQVLVDGPLIEAFVDERAMLTEKVYPAPEGRYDVTVVRGSAEVETRGWECGRRR
ncbi:GH32 C-terminal domain-containing protein [Streptomyces sp. NPDC021622]|uniref:GH32 C-terminal domain-containing protein n=1 Tax=Streptomyces sp. NPDC021622 TaxID=3155013 RepID=UPI0033D76B52